MPYQPHLDRTPMAMPSADRPTSSDWRDGLPLLAGALVTLRELRETDAQALFAMLSTEEVSRFISPPPSTVEGFERFIAWTHRQRAAGQYVCFAVVPHGSDVAIGLFQVRSLEPGFGTAEWGFALGADFWGTGLFVDGAKLVLDFAFDVVGAHRLEGRAAEDWRRAGRRAAPVVSPQRRTPRSGAVVGPRPGLARRQVGVGLRHSALTFRRTWTSAPSISISHQNSSLRNRRLTAVPRVCCVSTARPARRAMRPSRPFPSGSRRAISSSSTPRACFRRASSAAVCRAAEPSSACSSTAFTRLAWTTSAGKR